MKRKADFGGVRSVSEALEIPKLRIRTEGGK